VRQRVWEFCGDVCHIGRMRGRDSLSKRSHSATSTSTQMTPVQFKGRKARGGGGGGGGT